MRMSLEEQLENNIINCGKWQYSFLSVIPLMNPSIWEMVDKGGWEIISVLHAGEHRISYNQREFWFKRPLVKESSSGIPEED